MRVKSWKVYKLGDCVKFLSGGTPSKQKPEYWDGSIPWVSCKDMKTTYLYDSQDHITEAGAANGTRIVDPETILIVVRGMILGQHFPVAMTKRRVAFNQDLKALQCSSAVNTTFLFYWLQANSYEILGLADEAAHGTKRLQSDRLQNFPLNLPPLATQYKIATIFSAYDHLIENNTRRIKILEEMARSLYDEWFVKFRFPGYEQTKMVDSELGLIPKGWELKAVGELLSYHIGGGWGQEEESSQYPTPAYVIRGTDIPEARYGNVDKCPFRFHAISNFKSRKLEVGDIIFELSGGSKEQLLGRTLLISQYLINLFNEDIICASLCKLIRSNREIIFSELLYLHFLKIYSNGRIGQYQVQSTGISNFKFSVFLENELVIVPNFQYQTKFMKLVTPMFDLIQNLGVKNANLRRTRDLLLPKLITGEIDVENLDIETGVINESKEVSNSSHEAIAQ